MQVAEQDIRQLTDIRTRQGGPGGWGLWMAAQMRDVVSAVKTPSAFTVHIISYY